MSEESTNLEQAIKHDYAQIGGVRLHYARAGFGEKLVVLLHGFPECWYSWRHQLLTLAQQQDYTVVAPDMRGYNLSDKPPRIKDYKIEKLVDDVTGLIRHLGRERAAIVGHDWGASVIWATAQRHPEYLWKLAALQVPPWPVWKKNLTLRQFFASWYTFFFQIPYLPEWLIKRNNYAMLEDVFKNTTAVKGIINDTDIAVYKKAMSEPGALTAAINYYRANIWSRFFSKDDEMVKRRIKVHTLFIYGEKDHAVLPSTVKGVKEFIDAPYKEVHIPHSAHWVQQEAKEEVTKALIDFLAE
jgi:pimeloyl-ACP methyl ester carboxylesterase